MSGWISVEDRLPDEKPTMFAPLKGTDKWKPAMFEKKSDDVRCVYEFEDGARMVHHSFTVDGKWDAEKKSWLKRRVTHWMENPPLPDLPTKRPNVE